MAQSSYYGVILAGGRGTRFWPRSRRNRAKQVLNVTGERSLIQATVDRLRQFIAPEKLWVITNHQLREEIVRQLPELPKEQILAEPEQRNTAPAIGVAARILHSLDPDAVMGVFPADHVIANTSRYLELLGAAFDAAEKGKIAVLGIRPLWPETGYGYIEFPPDTQPGSMKAIPVQQFREKPDRQTAERYVAAGHFFWNAGMFAWRADVLLEALRRFLPKTASLIAALPNFSEDNFFAQLQRAFPLCENISIDYAVLERAGNVVGVACDDIGWSDVGSWNTLYELLPQDAEGNATRSEIISLESRGNYVDAGGKLVALLGVNNLIVVDTPDALLVADRARAQQVSEIVKLLESSKREELL